jgi:hypothetical protein
VTGNVVGHDTFIEVNTMELSVKNPMEDPAPMAASETSTRAFSARAKVILTTVTDTITAGATDSDTAKTTTTAAMGASSVDADSMDAAMDMDEHDADANGELMFAVRLIGRVFFGSGEFCLLPVLWCIPIIFLVIIYLRDDHISIAQVVQPMIALPLQATQMSQGYYLCKNNYISSITRRYCTKVAERRKALIVLERIARMACFIAFIFGIAFTIASLGYDIALSRIIIITTINLLTYVPLFTLLMYLFALWMWICWLVSNDVSKFIAYQTPQHVLDDSFITLFFVRVKKLHNINDEWNVWSAIRVVISIIFTWIGIQFGGSLIDSPNINYVKQGRVMLIYGFTFYVFIWIAISCGAMVNHRVVQETHNMVALMEYNVDQNDNPEDGNGHGRKEAFEQKRTRALIRINTIQNTIGIKLGPIILSSKHVFTIGSLLLTLITSTAYFSNEINNNTL